VFAVAFDTARPAGAARPVGVTLAVIGLRSGFVDFAPSC
jgi:hypothetical protein